MLKAFQDKNVTLMEADWTDYNDEISKALEGYGRASVPVYVLYGKSPNAAPILLPELLTPGIVLEALSKLP